MIFYDIVLTAEVM